MAGLSPQMKQVIAEQKLGFVASVDADGATQPYHPKALSWCWTMRTSCLAKSVLRVPCATLLSGPRVEVNFVDPIIRKGIRIKGTARLRGWLVHG